MTRLSDLAGARPGDRTFENLLRALTAQMDLCASMTLFRYEAQLEGHRAAVDAFDRVSRTERCAFEQLAACLQTHLDARSAKADVHETIRDAIPGTQDAPAGAPATQRSAK